MKEYTLVVMAAGMGSRFGGLKQITPIDDDGNFIIDYSAYDAKKSGFTKIVFVIKEENKEAFASTIGKRLEGKIKVEYAFQRKEDIPENKKYLVSQREKPWGTAQAILCASPYVNGPFAVINADDFYGYDAFHQAYQFLSTHDSFHEYACISYPFGVTASLEGAVKRGVLKLNDNKIESIIESSIEIKENKAYATPLDGSEPFTMDINAPVSMNMFAFQHDLFTLLEDYFENYFKQSDEMILKGEALLPECLKNNIENHTITIYSTPSKSKWLGMTYRSDLEKVKKTLDELKENKEYPIHL